MESVKLEIIGQIEVSEKQTGFNLLGVGFAPLWCKFDCSRRSFDPAKFYKVTLVGRVESLWSEFLKKPMQYVTPRQVLSVEELSK